MCLCEPPPAIVPEKAAAPRRLLRSRPSRVVGAGQPEVGPSPRPKDAKRSEGAAIAEEEAVFDDDHRTNQVQPSLKARGSQLSQALKTGTTESHKAAENVHFVDNFIQGRIDRELYSEMVSGLYHTYAALERLLEEHAPAHFPTLHFPKELNRVETLREDMEYWHGLDWESKPECRSPSPAVKDYVERMEEVAHIDPLLLLSHAYTRYLGDLSGGKVLARIARRALNLGKGHDGLQFYNFEHVKSAKLFKDAYREALDGLVLDAGEVGRVVAEANVAFALNMRVFEELDVRGGVPGARVRDVGEALSYYDRELEIQRGERDRDVSSSSQGEEEVKCPFGFAGGSSRGALGKEAGEEEAKCPFGCTGGSGHGARGKEAQGAHGASTKVVGTPTVKEVRCPWPFVFLHDPATGTRDWQTWLVVGLALCWFWSRWSVSDEPVHSEDAFEEEALVQGTDRLIGIFGACKYVNVSDLDWFIE